MGSLTPYFNQGMALVVNLATALVLFFAGRLLARWLAGSAMRLLEKFDVVEPILSLFLKNVLYYSLLAAVALAALGRLGINTTSFMAVLGAAGLAVGLALKDSLSNFAAGVMLIFFRPFKAGDFVTAAGVSGTVKEVSIFRTELATPDNQMVVVPNGAIMGGVITNGTAHATRRVDLVFGIGCDNDIDRAKGIISDVMAADRRILQDPAPAVGVFDLANGIVSLFVRPWTATADAFAVRCDLLEKVKKAFDEAGITMPSPWRDGRPTVS